MFEVAGREKTQAPPPHIVWRSLVDPHEPGTRPWLQLRDDEVEPHVLVALEPELVVWSSIWPARADDRIRFDVRPHDGGTALRWTLLAPVPEEDPEEVRRLRRRLNELINGSLRESYDQ